MNSLDRVRHTLTKESMTLLQILREEFDLEDQRAQELLDLGAIYVDKKRTFVDRIIQEGTYIRAHVAPRRYPAQEFDPSQAVIAETDDYVIIDKPHGLPVHPTLDNYRENIVDLLRHASREQYYVTQRLDVGTRGLFLLAKTERFQSYFNHQLREGRTHKVYHCLTRSPLLLGRWTHYMKPSDRAPRELSQEPVEGWQKCELIVEASDEFTRTHPLWFLFGSFAESAEQPAALSRLQLLTGRTHQIRTQLAYEGQPILGDTQYENPQLYVPWKLSFERFALACTSLGFCDLGGAECLYKLK